MFLCSLGLQCRTNPPFVRSSGLTATPRGRGRQCALCLGHVAVYGNIFTSARAPVCHFCTVREGSRALGSKEGAGCARFFSRNINEFKLNACRAMRTVLCSHRGEVGGGPGFILPV